MHKLGMKENTLRSKNSYEKLDKTAWRDFSRTSSENLNLQGTRKLYCERES